MLSIENIQPDDLAATAELHKEQLKLGLFPKLGRAFLRHYQETFAESPFGIALVARSDEGVVGALFGTTSNPDHYRWVIRNRGWMLACYAGAALVRRPHLAWTFASTRLRRYVNGLRRHAGSGQAAPDARSSTAVLSHIVTARPQHRHGIGRRLVEEFKRLARARGARQACLVTEEGGMGAPFFERIGCECVACRQGHDGVTLREYRLPLNEAKPHETIGYRRRGRMAARAYRRRLGRPAAGRDAR